MDAIFEALHLRMVAATLQLQREFTALGVTVDLVVEDLPDGAGVVIRLHSPEPAVKPASARKKAGK